MKEYDTFTLEELRCADYMANREGPGNGMIAPNRYSMRTTTNQSGSVSMDPEKSDPFGVRPASLGLANSNTSAGACMPPTTKLNAQDFMRPSTSQDYRIRNQKNLLNKDNFNSSSSNKGAFKPASHFSEVRGYEKAVPKQICVSFSIFCPEIC